MKNRYETYDVSEQLNDKYNIACEIIKTVEEEKITVEQDPNTLKDLIDMDLRENVPPQIFELISCVIDMIEKVEKR